jgi:hypothetical protein
VGGTLMTMKDTFLTQKEYSRLIYECIAQDCRWGLSARVCVQQASKLPTSVLLIHDLCSQVHLTHPSNPHLHPPQRLMGGVDGGARGAEATQDVDGQAGADGGADALHARPAALHHVCRLKGARRHLGQEQR